MRIIANLGTIISAKNQSSMSNGRRSGRPTARTQTPCRTRALLQITSDPEAYLRVPELSGRQPQLQRGQRRPRHGAGSAGNRLRHKGPLEKPECASVQSGQKKRTAQKSYTRSSFGKGYVLADVYDIRRTSGRELKHTALQPDSKEMDRSAQDASSIIPLSRW